METLLQPLLQQLGLLRQRQALLTPPDDNFNIFRLLRSAHDEVKLHSRFLFELLNPRGSHGLGDIFLRSFAQHCGFATHTCPVELRYDQVRAHRERGRMDLLIEDGSSAVIIENKIYAADQPKQLQRYHDDALEESWKPTLYYLTLDGHDPSAQSLGHLSPDKVQNIAYATEIDAWLTNCIQLAATRPGLRETLIQYQKLVQKLTGNAMADTKQQLITLLEQGDNGLDAGLLLANWPHIRHHVELTFWLELEKLVRQKYEISTNAKFDASRISRAINNARNRKAGYGIRATIGTLAGSTLQLKINRGESFFSYGLPAKDVVPNELRTQLKELLLPLQNVSKHDFWLVYRNSTLNFYAFTGEDTLALLNPTKRHAAIDKLWGEIQILLAEVSDKLKTAFPNEFNEVVVSDF